MLVFGIEISIISLILFYSILSGICLIVLASELYRLSSLLLIEKKAVNLFGKDLKKLEDEEKKIAKDEQKIAKEEIEIKKEETRIEKFLKKHSKRKN
ncbi:hypothetical protein ACFLQI_00505 [Candidatus Undinarchaeota archaeon]